MRRKPGIMIGLALLAMSTGICCVPPLDAQEVPRISAASALLKYNSGKVIVVDAMNASTYRKYHILGAISLPGDGPADLERIERGRLPIPKSQGIIVYCD